MNSLNEEKMPPTEAEDDFDSYLSQIRQMESKRLRRTVSLEGVIYDAFKRLERNSSKMPIKVKKIVSDILTLTEILLTTWAAENISNNREKLKNVVALYEQNKEVMFAQIKFKTIKDELLEGLLLSIHQISQAYFLIGKKEEATNERSSLLKII